MQRLCKFFPSIALALVLVSCSGQDSSQTGTIERPFVLGLIPSRDNVGVARLGKAIEKYMREKNEFQVRPIIADDAIVLIDSFGSGQMHGAFMNTLGYVVARDWARADAKLCLLFRSGSYKYHSKIVVRADRKYSKPSDLNGKTIAFKDRYATAGYLLGLKFIQDNSLKPAKTPFAGSYKNVVMGVYQGSYDAGAIYFDEPGSQGEIRDARNEIIKDHPDVGQKLQIFADAGSVKSSPVAFSSTVSPQTVQKFIDLLLSFSRTPEGVQTLLEAYDASALVQANDSEYDETRKILADLSLAPENLVPGGYKLRVREMISKTELP